MPDVVLFLWLYLPMGHGLATSGNGQGWEFMPTGSVGNAKHSPCWYLLQRGVAGREATGKNYYQECTRVGGSGFIRQEVMCDGCRPNGGSEETWWRGEWHRSWRCAVVIGLTSHFG